MSNYTAGPRGDSWQVRRDNAKRASAIVPTQKLAVTLAKRLAQASGGGEARTQNRQGRIIDSDTIAPAKDPFPPRDLKR